MKVGLLAVAFAAMASTNALAQPRDSLAAQRDYARRVATTGDSAYVRMFIESPLVETKFLLAVLDPSANPPPFSFDSLMNISLDRRRALRSSAAAFDSKDPPPLFSETHRLMLDAIGRAAQFYDSLGAASIGCGGVIKVASEQRATASVTKDVMSRMCFPSYTRATDGLKAARESYSSARDRVDARLRAIGIDLPRKP